MKYTYFFRRYSVIIIHIYDYSCVICGLSSAGLEIHHIDKNIENNAGTNLVPLCKCCHKTLHKNLEVDFSRIIESRSEELKNFDVFRYLHNE